MPKYTPIIGLEIHAELNTKSKMFCSCENGYQLRERPNENICPVCLAHPGTLPVINRQAVEWTILVGLALHCQLARQSKFDRKNYFYPDLPKGYQISQYDLPLTFGGNLRVGGRDIGIIRIHLEEDTGKLIHAEDGTLVDLTRAGTPLIELVSAPEIESAKEAKEFCQLYQQILRYLGVSEADMEKGQMRCEANVSLQEAGRFVIDNGEVKPLLDYQLNNKVELKNINSFRSLERAIEFEIKRQTKALEAGEHLIQETRGWDENKQNTFSQRVKETAADYRYFPEPDLPPLNIAEEMIANLRATLPELPQAKIARLVGQYRFLPEDAAILASDQDLAAYAEQSLSELVTWLHSLPEISGTEEEIWDKEGKKLSKLVGNWLINRLLSHLNETKTPIKSCRITPENFAEFITLIYQGRINNLAAQELLAALFETGENPTALLESKGLAQLDNESELSEIIDSVIAKNSKAVAEFQNGKEASFKFLVGQAMASTKGKANPQLINKLLLEKLK